MVIFDLDGTLWDSAESVAESWNIEIERVTGSPSSLTADDVRRNMGKTMNDIADDLMGEYELPFRYELARRCEVFENAFITEHGGELFEGVRETLQEMQERPRGSFLPAMSRRCLRALPRRFWVKDCLRARVISRPTDMRWRSDNGEVRTADKDRNVQRTLFR